MDRYNITVQSLQQVLETYNHVYENIPLDINVDLLPLPTKIGIRELNTGDYEGLVGFDDAKQLVFTLNTYRNTMGSYSYRQHSQIEVLKDEKPIGYLGFLFVEGEGINNQFSIDENIQELLPYLVVISVLDKVSIECEDMSALDPDVDLKDAISTVQQPFKNILKAYDRQDSKYDLFENKASNLKEEILISTESWFHLYFSISYQ